MSTAISRRDFVANSAKGIAATLLTFSAVGTRALANATGSPEKKTIIDLDAPANKNLKQVGGAVKIPNPADSHRPLIVTRISTGEYAAFSSRCTHLGCEVELPVYGVILCKCHHSKFDLYGKVTKGPARRDLPKYKTSIQGSQLEIGGII